MTGRWGTNSRGCLGQGRRDFVPRTLQTELPCGWELSRVGSGPSPGSCHRGVARRRGVDAGGGVLKREKPPLPGFVSPSWGLRERRRGRGAAEPAQGRFYRPRKEGCPRTAAAFAVAARSPPRLFPRLSFPLGGGGGGGEPQ